MTAKPLLLSAALAAALFAAMPALAQDSGDDAIVAEATVPAGRLADRYAELAGSTEAAADYVSALRTGGDFTVTQTVTTTNADGTTTTSTVDTVIANPAGPMGYGEVNLTLAIAQALVDSGAYPDLQSALSGTSVTNADGTVTTSGGVLAMRADGMGWGQIAKELGFNLGALVSAGNSNGKAQAGAAHTAKADKGATGTGKPDRVAKVERPSRPDKVDRPQKPDRPERPQKPDRPGRP